MRINTDKLDEGGYPPEPECQVNSKDCSFDPIHALCHECGRRLCENCGIGVRHQPQMFKYFHIDGATEDRAQLHCPDCAASHTWNTTILAAGGGAALLGLLLVVAAGAQSIPIAVIGLIILGVGGYLLYNEYNLKQELDAREIGA